jgi:hypothetical protein
VVLKLMDAENQMEVWLDGHEEPNIDATYVGFKGRTASLPPGMRLDR